MDDLVRLAHNIDLPFAAGKPPPSEFRLFAAGKIETTKGAFVFDAKAAELVMAADKEWGNDYPVDYDHAMAGIFSMDPAEAGKAAGWFRPELRAGELWATNVSWTPKAAEKLSAREYRYTSPAFHVEKDGNRISQLINVALTNLPATKKHTPLMANRAGEPGKEHRMKTLAIALSLAAEATEAELLSAITGLQAFGAQVLAATGAKAQAEALGILAAWKGNADRIATLSQELAAFKAKEADAAIESLITAGKAEGKITPASEAQVRKLAKDHGADALKGFLAFAQAAPKPLEDASANNTGTVELTAAERAYAEKHKIDLAAMAETKKTAISAGTYPG